MSYIIISHLNLLRVAFTCFMPDRVHWIKFFIKWYVLAARIRFKRYPITRNKIYFEITDGKWKKYSELVIEISIVPALETNRMHFFLTMKEAWVFTPLPVWSFLYSLLWFPLDGTHAVFPAEIAICCTIFYFFLFKIMSNHRQTCRPH